MNGWIFLFVAGGVTAEALAWLTIRAVSREDAEFRRRCDEIWRRIHER